MKAFRFLLMMSCFFILSFADVFSQNFQKYKTWASENHQHDEIRFDGIEDYRVYRLIRDHQNNVVNYEDVRHAVTGDFNGNGIVETAIITQSLDIGMYIVAPIDTFTLNHTRFFTIESRGYTILDPIKAYEDPQVVVDQEGINIARKEKIIANDGRPIGTGEFTPRPTVLRKFINHANDQSFYADSVKFAVAGDFDNNGKDEIGMIYNSSAAPGLLRLKLASNNVVGNSLDYGFDIDTAYTFSLGVSLSQIRYVVSGNFDSDAETEIAICYDDNVNSKSQVILLQRTSGVWATTTVMDIPYSNWAYSAVRHAVAGDFDGNGQDELAMSYHYGYTSTSRQKLFISDASWALSAIMDTVFAQFDLDLVKKMTAGDFDGNGSDEIAMFYDHPAKYEISENTLALQTLADSTKATQEVFVTDHQTPMWKFPSAIKEKVSNLNFEKIKFAFAENFDYDVLHRDDLSIMYMDQAHTQTDGQGDYGNSGLYDDKILTWISLPKFSDNDFAITAKDSNDVEQPFFPLGWAHVRLTTDTAVDFVVRDPESLIFPAQEVRQGKLPEETLKNYAKIYNTVVAERWTYTDSYHYGLHDAANDTSRYNFFTGYEAGLEAYLNKADSLGLKVIPFLSAFELQNLDENPNTDGNILPDDWSANYFTSLGTLPQYFDDILSNSSIMNHRSVIAWYTQDEPSLVFGRGEIIPGDVTETLRFVDSARPWITAANGIDPGDRTLARQLIRNLNARIKEASPSALTLVNYHSDKDFDFYDNTDISCYDMYTYWVEKLTEPQQQANTSTQNIIGAGTFEFESVVRNNQVSPMLWIQGFGQEARFHDKINNIPDHPATARIPTREEYRFALFAPAIIGLRGTLFWRYESETKYHAQKDTLFTHADTASDEFNHYIDIFLTSPIRGKVSTNFDRFVANDWHSSDASSLRYSSTFNHSLHKDSATGIHYLFVVNGEGARLENVEMTVFDQAPNATVYELEHDYFKNKNYRVIPPTGISTQSFLTFKDNFAPYEVKIYTIGAMPVARPFMDSLAYGSLAYNGQSKLVAYPDTVGRDSMVYHTVYHRMNSGRMKVFYRKSKPWVRSKGDMIEWGEESALSDALESPTSGTIAPTSCAYPSMVVRVDSADGKTKAYVVYSCYGTEFDTNYTTSQFIVESKFRVDTIVPSSLGGNIIAHINGGNPNNWGTPVINSSQSGNFYIWSDSTRGMVGAWKPIAEDEFTFSNDTVNMHWNTPIKLSGTAQAQHPSTHTYTDDVFSEDCSVVWQEKASPTASSQIYYTRLRLDNNGELIHTLPPTFTNQTDIVTQNAAKTIAHMSDVFQANSPNSLHKKPVIYRGPCGCETCPDKVFSEKLYWETDSVHVVQINTGGTTTVRKFSIPRWHISHRHLEMAEQTVPSHWAIKKPSRIYSYQRALLQPNVAQGTLTSTYRYPGDGPVNFNFISSSETATNYANSFIWNMPQDETTLLNKGEDNYIPYTTSIIAQKLEAFGQYPHVANRPREIRSSVTLPRDRRIFETSEANPPRISSSVQFFTGIQTQDTRVDAFVGFTNDSLRFILSPPIIDGHELKLSFPVLPLCSSPIGLNYKDPIFTDTIKTVWFPVDRFGRLDLVTMGSDTAIVSIELERESDNTFTPIKLPVLSDSLATITRIILRNGDSTERYRIVVAKRDTTVSYTEEIVIDGAPFINDSSGGGIFSRGRAYNEADNMQVLYLTPEIAYVPTLTLYPNPAQDYIMADIYSPDLLPGDCTVKIASLTGNLVAHYTTPTRTILRIPTDELANGIYTMFIEHPSGIHLTQTFVIER